MALSNRDRIDRMFQVLAPALDDFISTVVGQGDPSLGAVWAKLVQAKDSKNGAPSTKAYDALDPAGAVPDAYRGQHHRRVQAGLVPVQSGDRPHRRDVCQRASRGPQRVGPQQDLHR